MIRAPGTSANWLATAARRWPERTAVVEVGADGRRTFTYEELDRRARAVAGWFDAYGLERGDRVALLAPNGVAYLDLFFACAKRGLTLAPLNWRLSGPELLAYLRSIRPAVVFHSPELESLARAAGAGTTEAPAVGLAALEDIADRPGPFVDAFPVHPEAIACLLMTGGTTATPKAARIPHRMIQANMLSTTAHELAPGDVTIASLPMFHAGGLLVYALPLLATGGRVVLQQAWSAAQFVDLVARERPTVQVLVPTQCQQLLDEPGFDGAAFDSLRFVTTGGAPQPRSLAEAWRARCPVPLKQGYGMTEFGPGVFSMDSGDAARKQGSIGRPNVGVEARVAEPRAGADGVVVGELQLRGAACFAGYDDCDDTAAAFTADGWFRTGDLVRIDDDGFFFIAGRSKEMYISGGENVYPAEIEAVLDAHPDVAACAIVGAPDVRWGEVGRAFVVPRPGAELTEADLVGFVERRLARYKVPRSIDFVDGLPLTAAGKIDKKRLLR